MRCDLFFFLSLLAPGIAAVGCHGPSWVADPCVLLPFRTTHASTTPAQFSHADQYLVRTTAGALLPSYFSIVVAARGVAGSNCTRVRVELLPPPALRTAWGGLDETFDLTTRAAALANVFAAPPAALNASSGNWTLVVSTWPHTTTATLI